jgi:AcrR family transcriptional regulator
VNSTRVAVDNQRLHRDDRRRVLLDATAALVISGDIESVTMDAVAEQAGVSRPLVYKHFANRAELLEELYARESAALHEEMATEVGAARTLEEMFRALVRGSLRAQASRGATFAALRAGGGLSDAGRSAQRVRDRNTLRFFVREAMREYDMAETQARAAVSILLGAISSVLNAFRARPTREHAELLEETYVALVTAGLKGLASEA